MWGGILSTLPSFMHSSDISTSLPVECSTVAHERIALTMGTMHRDRYHNTLPLSTCCPATLPHHSLFSHYHFLQVGAVNSGRKTAKTSIMGAGRGMNILLG